MKIVHLSSGHSVFDSRIFVKECRSLVAAGFEVHLVVVAEKDQVVDGVHIHGVDVDWKSRFERFTKVDRLVVKKALSLGGDVYHLHDPSLIRFTCQFKKKSRFVIYDSHEDFPRQTLSKEFIPEPLRRPLSYLVEKIENYYLKNVDHVIAATPSIEGRFRPLGTDVVTVRNFPIVDELANGNHDWSERDRKVCYVGGISRIRGVFEMIRAMQRVDGELCLAGIVPNELRSEIESTTGWGKVNELGFVGREKVKDILSECRVGLVLLHPVPNYVESLPIKMFEYMSAGLPVICSNFPYWEDIVKKGECGLCVDPFNTREIANAINVLLDDPERAREMGRNGQRIVQEEYNWSSEEEKIVNLYKNL